MSEAVEFEFIGETDTTETRVDWPELAHALMIRNQRVLGQVSRVAIENAVVEYNEMIDNGEVEGEHLPTGDALPKSYKGDRAPSTLSGIRKRFLERFNKGVESTVELNERYGLLQRKED